MIPIKEWVQPNIGDTQGTLFATFNADFTQKKGRARSNRSKLVYNTASDADFGLVTDICFFDHDNDLMGEYVFRAGGDGSVGGGIFFGDQNPSDTLTENTISAVPSASTIDRGGLAVFNNKLYAADAQNILSFDKGEASSWDSVSSGGLALSEHHMRVFRNRLYVTDNDDSVLSVNTSSTLATSGAYTLDLAGFENLYVTFILPADETMYIGTLNEAGGHGVVFEWDGVTENTPTTKYTLDSQGVLAGVMKNGVPYMMDIDGRLIALSGRQFVEVARLPFDKRKPLFNVSNLGSSTLADRLRFIHPNGMTLVEGEINMVINGRYADSTQEWNIPSGVWEYTEANGLYHKNSPSYSAVGGTTSTDFGQQHIAMAGAIAAAPNGNSDSDRNGTYLFGAKYYTDATATTYGLFIDDTLDTTKKHFSLITPKLTTEEVAQVWQKVIIKHPKLLSSTDKLVFKYRLDGDMPTETTITWVNTTTCTVSGDISAYAVGDEMEVYQGVGSGKCAHISGYSKIGTDSYTLTLDETFTGATGTAKARFSKWKKLAERADQNTRFDSLTMNATAPWVQLKICGEWTGENEIEEVQVINQAAQRSV